LSKFAFSAERSKYAVSVRFSVTTDLDSNWREHALQRKQFKGLLLKKIDPSAAPTLGLRGAFALPPDEEDVAVYIQQEKADRWVAFDRTFGLDTSAPDIAVQRVIALIEYDAGIDPDDPQWIDHVADVLACRRIPGFCSATGGSKRHGAPIEWTGPQLAELFADIEFLRKKTGKTVKEICRTLPNEKGYYRRWRRYSSEVLRKAYTKARKNSRGLLFQLEHFGPKATIPAGCTDPTEAAIGRHALKI
jgi:hypothetical protein